MLLHLESNFYRHKGSKNGRRNICKQCYALVNSENMKRSAEKRKANMKIGGKASNENRKKVLEEFGYRCALTGELEGVTVDHFVPLDWGKAAVREGIGGNSSKNLIPLIEPLNKSKWSNNPFIWFENLDELKVKYGLCDQKWWTVVEFVAAKHNMSAFEYKIKVNNCYWEVIAEKYMEILNYRLENYPSKYKPYSIIWFFLKNCFNLDVVINRFGSKDAKKFYYAKETCRKIELHKASLME
ncbi:hypothetical protein [Sutcliffiella horikoshii]|uniref:hypothetical protein n=1 Tax=Sutcliffiella horikoshii TaxID=79883 RepID=UPI001CFD61E1|nr:hypothetical protein [Sutcliffiella horikoshii]